MTSQTLSNPSLDRKAWLAVLARSSWLQLAAHKPAPEILINLERVRPPEIGMMMLRGRVGGTGNPFNLGEATVVRSAVRLGDGPLGVSYALGRDKRHSELAAIFDALLQDPLHFTSLMHDLIKPLAQAQAQASAAIQNKMASSKVEFFTFVRGEA
jgi:alpha-D-ribose 1-methylphosphonate 5-triphosphate synthase subunit PhnG